MFNSNFGGLFLFCMLMQEESNLAQLKLVFAKIFLGVYIWILIYGSCICCFRVEQISPQQFSLRNYCKATIQKGFENWVLNMFHKYFTKSFCDQAYIRNDSSNLSANLLCYYSLVHSALKLFIILEQACFVSSKT